jgi:hypothetical protein
MSPRAETASDVQSPAAAEPRQCLWTAVKMQPVLAMMMMGCRAMERSAAWSSKSIDKIKKKQKRVFF